ncbi:MAG: Gfo/Idh/MocA family oxidoreductase [Nitrospiraceae bacterium]|nr:Gfo/Idh/MocA family oxidoreductase [Nitrospiraceae bacterium]
MNVAIIGCNGMGRMHAQMAVNCGFNVVACADLELSTARSVASGFDADATDDCFGVLTRPDVDVVGIMTPTPTHTEYVVAAAKAGKHIFCEKPFGRTVQQCKEAIAAAKKARVKLFVGHVVRYFQEFEAMRAQVAQGKVGKVGFVRLYRGGIFPAGQSGWFRDLEQSGGVTLDSMIHDFDWLRYVFGDADRVFCQALQRTVPNHVDYSMATFRMKNGIIAKVIGTWAHPSGFRVEAEICGDQGIIQFNSDDTPLKAMKRTAPGAGASMIVPSSPVHTSPYQLEWEDFKVWLDGKLRARVTPEDALEAVRMATAALKSAETGKPVKL